MIISTCSSHIKASCQSLALFQLMAWMKKASQNPSVQTVVNEPARYILYPI